MAGGGEEEADAGVSGGSLRQGRAAGGAGVYGHAAAHLMPWRGCYRDVWTCHVFLRIVSYARWSFARCRGKERGQREGRKGGAGRDDGVDGGVKKKVSEAWLMCLGWLPLSCVWFRYTEYHSTVDMGVT